MKTVFLIIFFWHSNSKDFKTFEGKYGYGIATSQTGGSNLHIIEMPSLSACEAVGIKTKIIVDIGKPKDGNPAVYACIETTKEEVKNDSSVPGRQKKSN